MEEIKETTQNGEKDTQNAGENNANQAKKTFTQDEVNRIVQDRLAKERSRAGQSLEDRERDLTRRESRMACAERLAEKGYSKELLDILDTSDADKFMNNIKRLETMGVVGQNSRPKPPFVVGPTSGMCKQGDADLRAAFGLARKDE